MLTVPVSYALGICSPGVKSSGEHVSTVTGSGVHVPVKGIQGGSALLYMENLGIDPGHHLTEVTWSFCKTVKRKILQVNPIKDPHIYWYKPEDKQRFCVLNKIFLRIENLTLEDTGLYEAEVTLIGGNTSSQVFNLTVYGTWPHTSCLYLTSPSFCLWEGHRRLILQCFYWEPAIILHFLFEYRFCSP